MSYAALREPTFWILTALARGRRHGYGMIEDVRAQSSGNVELRVATLYSALDRLADEGLIEVDGDEIHEGRARRYFRITGAGLERLRVEADRLASSAAAARASLDAAGGQSVVFA